MTLATGASAGAGGSSFTLLILALPILFLLFLMFSQRRRAKAMNEAQQALQPGQEVMTTAGLYAVVTGIEGDVVHLRVADGVVLRHQRRSVVPLSMTPGGGPDAGGTTTAGPGTADGTDSRDGLDGTTGGEPRR